MLSLVFMSLIPPQWHLRSSAEVVGGGAASTSLFNVSTFQTRWKVHKVRRYFTKVSASQAKNLPL